MDHLNCGQGSQPAAEDTPVASEAQERRRRRCHTHLKRIKNAIKKRFRIHLNRMGRTSRQCLLWSTRLSFRVCRQSDAPGTMTPIVVVPSIHRHAETNSLGNQSHYIGRCSEFAQKLVAGHRTIISHRGLLEYYSGRSLAPRDYVGTD